MKLSELLDLQDLRGMIAEGYVGVQYHPTAPLAILNYSHAAQYDKVWNAVTRQCRGLIVRMEGGWGGWADAEIVARPWPKFYNYGEFPTGPCAGARDERCGDKCACFDWPVLDLDAPCRVFDKMDGSLGILYWSGTNWAISTRGSFTSEQALHATAVYQAKYAATFSPDRSATYLFEIIYPENRIVLDYDGLDDLVFLGAVDIETGEHVRSIYWHPLSAARMNADTLREALALEPRPNAEGVVVSFDSGLMVKIKQEDYVALHRIVTGLNAKTVWERIGAGETVRDICANLPDEFAAWVEDIAAPLLEDAADMLAEAREIHNDIVIGVSLSGHRDWSRADYAAEAKKHGDYTPLLFLLFDGKEERAKAAVWRMLKPRGGTGVGKTLLAITEDTA